MSMWKRIACALIVAIILSFTLLVGWMLYTEAYNAGRKDPDWANFDLWIYPDEGFIYIEVDEGLGCSWQIDPSMFLTVADNSLT